MSTKNRLALARRIGSDEAEDEAGMRGVFLPVSSGGVCVPLTLPSARAPVGKEVVKLGQGGGYPSRPFGTASILYPTP
jgi:hypothetical protein